MAVYFRGLSEDFQIDGVSCPIPNEYNTVTQLVATDDSQRLAGNGEMQIELLTHIFVTTWKYTFMTGDEFDIIYNKYIRDTIRNRNMYHQLKTINSNTGNSLNYKIYAQNEMKAELKKYNTNLFRYMGITFINGVRVYQNVEFTFVGVGGESYDSQVGS